MKTNKLKLALILTLSILTACGNKDNSDGDSAQASQSSPTGNWKSGCFAFYNTNLFGRASLSLQDGGSTVVRFDYFTDAACSNNYMYEEFNGTYTLAGLELTYGLSVGNIVPLSATVASTLNTKGSCGFKNWAANAAKTFAVPNSCFSSIPRAIPAAGKTTMLINGDTMTLEGNPTVYTRQ